MFYVVQLRKELEIAPRFFGPRLTVEIERRLREEVGGWEGAGGWGLGGAESELDWVQREQGGQSWVEPRTLRRLPAAACLEPWLLLPWVWGECTCC